MKSTDNASRDHGTDTSHIAAKHIPVPLAHLESFQCYKELASAISIDREDDGRFIAEVQGLPGVMVYGQTEAEARREAIALALRVRLDGGC
jgi:hypothetical protein